MIPHMTYSRGGLHLTEQFESCQLVAYLDLDKAGIPTIGYGHTAGVKMGDHCTMDQAEAWLASDTEFAANCVNVLVQVSLTQDEFDALTDFVFNCGCHAFGESTLLALLNERKYADAALQFDRWDHDHGKVIAGLLRRREVETAEFKGTDGEPTS